MSLEEEFKKLSKEEILKVFRLFNKNWMTVDSLWFSTVEDMFGVEAAKKVNLKVSEAMAPRMAKRTMETFGLKGDKIQDLAKALKFIVWASIQKIEFEEFSKDSFIMRVVDCIPQKTRIKNGKEEFPCKPMGLAFLTNFAKTVNPKFKVECLRCPPDPHPENVWCEWKFYVEAEQK
ncbi:MAG: hypothetical protein DRO36_02490 [Candidatus Hecatellales archaeon]|nr:MAG: hypothetical protein DRO36_02490 [Candidatus Hecatellales archaeon]